MWQLLLITLATSLGINLVLFIFAYSRKSDRLTDISYAISFLAVDIIALIFASAKNTYSIVLFLLVALWALRIGAFLLIRVIVFKKDKRFDEMRDSFLKFGWFWLAQALTAWILMIPTIMAQKRGAELNALSYAAIAIWAVAIIIETTADYQKFIFKLKKNGKHPWIDSGVWKYSRHPNYLGEMLTWLSIYLFSFKALDSLEKLLGLISPIFIYLLLRYVSGVPILEKSADQKWGKDKDYQKYKKSSRLLVPLPKAKS
jgi:steroid 5-alpha reductase family enzyme